MRVSNNAGSVGARAAPPARLRARLNHTWQGRPWVRILRSGDAVPDTASAFGPCQAPFTPVFTLHDQVIHATVRADATNAAAVTTQNALVRWVAGTLATLVFTNTPLPEGGGNFTYPSTHR